MSPIRVGAASTSSFHQTCCVSTSAFIVSTISVHSDGFQVVDPEYIAKRPSVLVTIHFADRSSQKCAIHICKDLQLIEILQCPIPFLPGGLRVPEIKNKNEFARHITVVAGTKIEFQITFNVTIHSPSPKGSSCGVSLLSLLWIHKIRSASLVSATHCSGVAGYKHFN